MTGSGLARRASYGPGSPVVGVRGASTRQQIVEGTLKLFAEVGYFDASVDAIAKSVNISRATLYQYFRGKEEIYDELLDECGRALVRVVRRLGPLGPTEVGFDNLNWWIDEWSWVFEKYSTMFIQWMTVTAAEPEIRNDVERFAGKYTHLVAERIAKSGVAGLDSFAAAVTITALVHRMNLFIHTGRVYGRSRKSVVDAVSVHLQLFLFPETSLSVLRSLVLSEPDFAPITIPPCPRTNGLSIQDRTRGLNRRPTATIHALLDAGAVRFRRDGYHRTRVGDIVREAGFARGTFYKYFDEKQDMFLTLSVEASRISLEHAEQLQSIRLTATSESGLREWIASFMSFVRYYAGSLEAWTDTRTEAVAPLNDYTRATMDSALRAMLSGAEREYPFDPTLAGIMVRALIGRLPQAANEVAPSLSHQQVVDLVVAFIDRGVLSTPS